MKRLLVLAFMCSTLPAISFDGLPTVPLSEISPMHDMQSMQAQKFRQEQINYYNDVQTEKERFKKRNKTEEEQAQEIHQQVQEIQQQVQQAVQQKVNNAGKSEFVQENGQLKIKYMH